MENQEPKVTKPETTEQATQKLPYEPPKAVFVPLKLEERLKTCGKLSPGHGMNCSSHTQS